MKKQVYICDRCGTQIEDEEKPFLFSLFKERKSDPAGGSEDWYYQSDLCQRCVIILADRLMKFIDKNVEDQVFKSSIIKDFRAVAK